MCRNLGENVWCSFKLREKSNSGAGADNGAMILSRCCFLEIQRLRFYGAM